MPKFVADFCECKKIHCKAVTPPSLPPAITPRKKKIYEMSETSDILDNFQYFLNPIKNMEISVLLHQPIVSDDFKH